MNERLLQFIWQFQYFNKHNLTTVDGLALTILQQGKLNTNQGPDFLQAKIRIGNTEWIGNVELHVKTSQWNEHGHTADKNYSNIILHVVWQHDKELSNTENIFPTLELQSFVSKIMLQKYEQLMHAEGFVPCENFLPALSDMGWVSWKERLIAERLQRKAEHILKLLAQANNHWEELFWWLLARNFGIKVNADFFEQLAKTIPVNILAKHKQQLIQIEALLLGQAQLLNTDFTEEYPRLLQREYKFMATKYKLVPMNQSPHFLRMRPANFPTVRLAQLAALIVQSTHLFSKMLEQQNIAAIKNMLNVIANDYWHYHYRFDEPGEYKQKKLGNAMIENIIINTVAPTLFAYGMYHAEQKWKDRAVELLSNLSSETNNIITSWKNKNVQSKTALDSQALIELKNIYCNQKRCLHCAVANKILKNE